MEIETATQHQSIRPRGRPRTRTYETILATAREYYHIHKPPSEKKQCAFVNYRGVQCVRITKRYYCHRHIKRLPTAENSDDAQ